MPARIARFVVLAIGLALVAAILLPAAVNDHAPFAFDLELVADGFEQPVQVVDPADGSGRLVVVEQTGRLRIVHDRQISPAPMLDITDRVSCCGERGLLSAAFHPEFAATGQVFVNYTDEEGDTVVARYRVSGVDPNRLDAASEENVLAVDQPASNHNGGLVLFDRDGYLYIGLGDGGGGNSQNGQELDTLLGKILRIDVDASESGRSYAIPPDNPFVNRPDARPEIWAYGLRNPWRFSFDRDTGDLWIGDVGSATYEEVNVLPASSAGGENFGWAAMEGYECREAEDCGGLIPPVSGFDRSEGCVVTGGFVYRGSAVPDLVGVYLFADYCSGKIWGLMPGEGGIWKRIGPVETGLRIASFGEDAAGEVYVVNLDGSVFRLIAARGPRA